MVKYYTVKEVADILRFHPKTIYRFVAEGRIDYRRANGKVLIPETAVEQFVKKPKEE